ncbi:hypothetical protein KQY30_31875 [Streptomyces sp. GMY02]|uniref:hypothetical protein n=1 Tax=Streptomyces sp. GMY02 TaxID=1333528 RepID=UPI001C2C1BCB|nr:hypothetical protein [Streptomyces sp. GMY02]QXE38147.1 hypothetical protein KQY30_31875 [Streptomyces sp. GMY02]
MGGFGDLRFDEESVRRITEGLRAAVGELREVGTGTGAVLGKGFSELAMTGMEAGHRGLSVEFEDFCERWEWGVRALVQDANTIASTLGLAAGLVWEEDQYIQGTFKVAVNAAVGNPHASEEEITGQGWGDVLTPDYLSPDYSAESFQRAGDEALQTWRDTGRTVLTEGQGGRQSRILNDLLGVDEQSWDQALDDTFGPSPEERAQQAQQAEQPDSGGN